MRVMEWKVDSDCEEVRIESSHFSTEKGRDYLKIEEMQYSGEGIEVNQVVAGSFAVTFISNGGIGTGGFVLHWSCHQTGT